MTFAQRRISLTTHFSRRIPVVKRCMTVLVPIGTGNQRDESTVSTERTVPGTFRFLWLTRSGRGHGP